MKNFLRHPLVYCLTASFIFCMILFGCFALHAQAVDSLQLQYQHDTALVGQTTRQFLPLIKQFVPAQYQTNFDLFAGLAVSVVILLIGIFFAVKHLKGHITDTVKNTATIILILLMLGLNSCSVGKYITSHCSINPSVTQSSGGSGEVCFSCDSVALLLKQVPANLMLKPVKK